MGAKRWLYFVKHLKVIGGDHDWPGVTGNMDIDTDSELWNFMSQFNSNGAISCQTATIDEKKHLGIKHLSKSI